MQGVEAVAGMKLFLLPNQFKRAEQAGIIFSDQAAVVMDPYEVGNTTLHLPSAYRQHLLSHSKDEQRDG